MAFLKSKGFIARFEVRVVRFEFKAEYLLQKWLELFHLVRFEMFAFRSQLLLLRVFFLAPEVDL